MGKISEDLSNFDGRYLFYDVPPEPEDILYPVDERELEYYDGD